MIDWYIEGIEFSNCNCDFGCPCQFEANPTDGTCRGFEPIYINKGQFAQLKKACLRRCRSPVEFLTGNRRPGNVGALKMGLHHGTYCLGCCWFLMILLFVGGIMNVFWIAGIALFVLVEKLFSRGVNFGRIAGVVLIVVGIVLLVT